MTDLPDWADSETSAALPALRAMGEGQDLEYKGTFPDQAHDLAKEIAAFSSSNSGRILIGVSDDGDLLGLGELDTPARDLLLQRIEGICKAIRPAVTPEAKWAVEKSAAVLVLCVPKGSEPVYYYKDKPYIRHITSSRPAEPHEVIELVRRYLNAHLEVAQEKLSPEASTLSEVAGVLAGILVWTEAPREILYTNPGLDQWRSDLRLSAEELRRLSAVDAMANSDLRPNLIETADALDEIGNIEFYIGMGNQLDQLWEKASIQSKQILLSVSERAPLSDSSLARVSESLRANSRRLQDLADRASVMAETGRLQELQTIAGDIGQQVLRVSAYDLTQIDGGLVDQLKKVGRLLLRAEYTRIYMDGGQSMREVIRLVEEAAAALRLAIKEEK